MKQIPLFIVAALVLACIAIGAKPALSASPNSAYSLKEATGNGTAVKTYGNPTKQIIVGHIVGTSFANYSGTVSLYGSQTASGPWYPLKDVQGTAITKTHDLTAAGAVFNVDDLSQYIRAVFTPLSGAVKNKITVIINYATRAVSP